MKTTATWRYATIPMALAGFCGAGLLVAVSPVTAAVAAGCVLALAALFARPQLLRFVVIGLVLVPSVGLLRSTGSAVVAAQLAQSIESGSWLNRAAATVLFAIGVASIGVRFRQLRQINLLPWFGLFLALVLSSLVWSDSQPLTLRRSVEALFIVVFALGVGGVYFGRRQEGHAEVIRTICWASSLMTFGILTAFLVRGEVHLTDPAWRLGHEGVENQVGWVASVGLLLAWVTRGRSDIWTSKPMLRFQLTVTGLGVLLSKSRETWLGVLAGVVAMQLIEGRSLRKGIAGAALVLVAVGALASIPAVQQVWQRGATEEDLESASGRTQLWAAAWPMIEAHLWLGHGLGAFWTPHTVLALSTHWSPTSLHNGYLDSVAELGVVGMALIALCFAISARNAWRLMRRGGDFEIGLSLLVLYASFAVINSFASILEVFNFFPVTAMLVLSFFVSRRLTLRAASEG